MTAQLHAAHDSCRLGAEHLARKADELAFAALAGDAEDALLVVELPHQLDDKAALFGK